MKNVLKITSGIILVIAAITFVVIRNSSDIYAKDNSIYDVILFWGQSNMVGDCGYFQEEKEKDPRYDNTNEESVLDFSKKSGIDKEILKNSEQMNYVRISGDVGTAYEYNYLNNNLIDLSTNPKQLGEKLKYDPSTKTLKSTNNSDLSLMTSFGSNMIPQFCKTYYEKTGHKVIAVFAAKGGQKIQNFLPSTDENYADTENRMIYESMVEKYNKAIKYMNDNDLNIGNKLYVCYQGENNVTDEDTTKDYKTNYMKVHNQLKKDTGITKGAIVEVATPIGYKKYENLQKIHMAQEQLINENSDIILGSAYPYNHYVPDATTYNSEEYKTKVFVDENGNKLNFDEAFKRSQYSVCFPEDVHTLGNRIHLTSAALSQVGKEVAESLSVGVGSLENERYYNNLGQISDKPDPFIFYNEKNGEYYLYSTNDFTICYAQRKFWYYKSKDLKNWTKCTSDFVVEENEGPILKDSNNNEITYKKNGTDTLVKAYLRKQFWAPEVYKRNETFYIFYSSFEMVNKDEVLNSANSNGGVSQIEPLYTKSTINVASSNSIEGPFKEIKKDLLNINSSVIDANVLFDDDGKIYLYYSEDQALRESGSHESWIYGVELNSDFNKIGNPVKLVCPEREWEKNTTRNQYWTEGPCVIKNEGKYYLMYSANGYRLDSYSVGYATATSPLGTYTKKGTNKDNILLETDESKVFGTGHNNVFKTSDGSLYTVYHVISKKLDENGNYVYDSRNLAFDQLVFKDGDLYSNGPTVTDEPIPVGTNGYLFEKNFEITTSSSVDAKCLNDGLTNYCKFAKDCSFKNSTNGGYDINCTFSTPSFIEDVWIYPSASVTATNTPTSATLLVNDRYAIDNVAINNSSDSRSPSVISLKNLKLGEKISNLKISFNGSTDTSISEIRFIKNSNKKLSKVDIDKMPTKLQYIQNTDDLDLTGGSISLTYNDGSSSSINMNNENVKVTGFSNEEIGNKTITLEYENVKVTFDIEIVKVQFAKVEPTNSKFERRLWYN